MAIIDCDFWLVRRKLGGACGSFCRGAPYIRLRPTPCNGSTRRQSRVRALWAYATWAWQGLLTAEERSHWNEDAEWWAFCDDQEQYRHLTGCEWWCYFAARMLVAGLPLWRDSYDMVLGDYVSALSVELVSRTRARLTFEPDPGPYHGFAAYGRGATSVGDSRVVPEAEWSRMSVLPGWRWIGFAGLGVGSPVELELPFTVAAGRKLRVKGCLMSDTGGTPFDWLTAEVVA